MMANPIKTLAASLLLLVALFSGKASAWVPSSVPHVATRTSFAKTTGVLFSSPGGDDTSGVHKGTVKVRRRGAKKCSTFLQTSFIAHAVVSFYSSFSGLIRRKGQFSSLPTFRYMWNREAQQPHTPPRNKMPVSAPP
jgi:hypothetical protein